MSTPGQGPPDTYHGPPRSGNQGPALVASGISCFIVAALFVALRILRTIRIKKFRWDDALILLALVFLAGITTVSAASTWYGEGRHIETVKDPQRLIEALRLPIIAQFLGAIALLLAKASIAVMLIQLRLGRAFDIAIILLLLFAIGGNLFTSIRVITGCNVRSLFYVGKKLPCSADNLIAVSTYIRTVANISLDILFFLLPIWFLRRVKMSSRDRVAVNILLSFLLLASVFSIVNAVQALRTLLAEEDLTWDTASVLCVQIGEITMSIMAACLPAIRQLLGKRFPSRWKFWHPAPTTDRSKQQHNTVEPTVDTGILMTRGMTVLDTTNSITPKSSTSPGYSDKTGFTWRSMTASATDKIAMEEEQSLFQDHAPVSELQFESRIASPFQPVWSPSRQPQAMSYELMTHGRDEREDQDIEEAQRVFEKDGRPVRVDREHEVLGIARPPQIRSHSSASGSSTLFRNT